MLMKFNLLLKYRIGKINQSCGRYQRKEITQQMIQCQCNASQFHTLSSLTRWLAYLL